MVRVANSSYPCTYCRLDGLTLVRIRNGEVMKNRLELIASLTHSNEHCVRMAEHC